MENLAPYSFFSAVAYHPPQLIVSSVGGKPDRSFGKDTISNIRETGIFCVNIASHEDAAVLNQSSANFPAAASEANHLGLDLAECRTIDCPRLVNAPASLECRLTQIIGLEGDANNLMIARVEAVHLRDDLIDDAGHFDVTRYRPLARLGYLDFSAIHEVFPLKRPRLSALQNEKSD